MAFGLCNYPATGQRLIEKCMNKLNPRDCLIYLVDLIMFLKTEVDSGRKRYARNIKVLKVDYMNKQDVFCFMQHSFYIPVADRKLHKRSKTPRLLPHLSWWDNYISFFYQPLRNTVSIWKILSLIFFELICVNIMNGICKPDGVETITIIIKKKPKQKQRDLLLSKQ